MSRCFILGAGFSKAVAGLPVMKEFADRFQEIRDREKALGHRNRKAWGDQILEFIAAIEEEFFRAPCVDRDETYDHCTLRENFESLVSYIDLNLSGQINATLTRGPRRSSFTKSPLFSNRGDLEQVRKCIETYMYLMLVGPWDESRLLADFIAHLGKSDGIVTFNYDLVLESALYKRELWAPANGYGFELLVVPRLATHANRESSWVIHKLHGSLNWKEITLFTPRLEVEWFYDDGTAIFSGYLEEPSKGKSIRYEGGHGRCWMMPSFVKEFAAPELLAVWRGAMSSLRKADEVVVVGYSLPKEDAAACLLLGTTGLEAKSLTIVDPNAEELRARLSVITGNKHICTFSGLDGYLGSSPPTG